MKIKESVEMMMLVLMAERKGKPHPPMQQSPRTEKMGNPKATEEFSNKIEMTEEKKLRKIHNKL